MVERISLRQLFFIAFITHSVVAVAEMQIIASYDVQHDVWISALLLTILGPCITWLIMTLGQRFPQETFVEYAPRVLGSVVGKTVALIYLLFLFHYGAGGLRIFGATLVTAFFEATPLVFILGLMTIVVSMGSRYGIEALCRLSDLFTPLFVLATLIVIAAAVPIMKPEWMLPVLAKGFTPVLLGTVTPLGIYVHHLYLLMLIPHVKDVHRARSVATWASFAASILVLLLTLVILLTFGPFEAHRLTIPVYHLARLVRLGEFYERVEAAAVYAWSLGLFVQLAIFLYVVTKGISQWLGVQRYRSLVFPTATIGLCLAMITFTDSSQLRENQQPSVFGVYWLVFIFPIIPIMLSVAALRKVPAKPPSEKDGKK